MLVTTPQPKLPSVGLTTRGKPRLLAYSIISSLVASAGNPFPKGTGTPASANICFVVYLSSLNSTASLDTLFPLVRKKNSVLLSELKENNRPGGFTPKTRSEERRVGKECENRRAQ